MSEVIDVAFDDHERLGYLDEVRHHLPAFLSEVAYGRAEPLKDVSALLNLQARDLRRVVHTHLAFTESIVRFADVLPEALRRPLSSSLRPPNVSQAVRGPVDWAATFRARYQQGGDPTLYVVRPAERIFDTPENQALRWFLKSLTAAVVAIRPVESDGGGTMREGESWYPQVIDLGRQLAEANRHRWLSAVTPMRPTARTLSRLRSARDDFYATLLPEAIETFLRYTERPSASDITELLCQRYFEPRLNWQLFELVIALRVIRTFEDRLGAKRSPSRLLVGRARRPFARYEVCDDVIQLWYQCWPDINTRSLLHEARERHRLTAGASRPDFVIERRSGAEVKDVVVLEVKASRNPRTLGAGLLQLLGYLKERPELWPKPTPGWIVAPQSSAFEPGDAEDEPLWMVTADAVADAAAERVLPGAMVDRSQS